MKVISKDGKYYLNGRRSEVAQAVGVTFDMAEALQKTDWGTEFRGIFNGIIQKEIQAIQETIPEDMRQEAVKAGTERIERMVPQLVETYAGLGMSRQKFADELASRIKPMMERIVAGIQSGRAWEQKREEQQKKEQQAAEKQEQERRRSDRQLREKQDEKKELSKLLKRIVLNSDKPNGNPADAVLDAYNKGSITSEQMNKLFQLLKTNGASSTASISDNWFKSAMANGGRL